jgi:toxin ParE1/3/4
MNRYRLSRRAERDLEDIWRYTASRWGVVQADDYLGSIISAMDGLADGGSRRQSAPRASANYARHLVGSHAIYSRTRPGSTTLIVRILHQSMDANAQLGKR